ncbi:MAG: rod shape-determining protein MreD [Solirubrobacterales bacterium]|nr:rod shape-determining protein MreD [Solirubrobacterales bacterium]HMT04010.1 rod shape-determining protein MreD [Solirubrobacterales bacterium]
MIITNRSALRIALLVLLVTVLQVSFFSQIELLGTSVWILPACAAIFGLLGGSLVGATVGFALGFLGDGLTDGPLGSASLILMGVGYLAGTWRERGEFPDLPAVLAICGIATLGSNLTLGVYMVVVGFDSSLSPSLVPDLILQSIYGVVLAIPLYVLIRRVLKPALVFESTGRDRNGGYRERRLDEPDLTKVTGPRLTDEI